MCGAKTNCAYPSSRPVNATLFQTLLAPMYISASTACPFGSWCRGPDVFESNIRQKFKILSPHSRGISKPTSTYHAIPQFLNRLRFSRPPLFSAIKTNACSAVTDASGLSTQSVPNIREQNSLSQFFSQTSACSVYPTRWGNSRM